MPYREGDHWVYSDVTGRKVLASRTVKQWSGGIVEREHAIDLHRHPQEIQRIVNEKQSVDNPRPRPPDIFIGPIQVVTLTSVQAGGVFLQVSSIAGIRVGDQVGVLLDNLDLWLTHVRQVYSLYLEGALAVLSELAFSEDAPSDTLYRILEVETPLPWSVGLGALVVDHTRTTRPDVIDESQSDPDYTPVPVRLSSFDASFDASFG